MNNLPHFDAVIGNPPYQKPGTMQKDDNLWTKFLSHSIKLADHVVFVTPSSWGSLGSNHTDMGSSIAKRNMRPYQVEFLDLNISHYFDVGSTFSAYHINTTKTGTDTTKLILEDGTEHDIMFSDFKCIPTVFNDVVLEALDKTIYSDLPKYKVEDEDAAADELGMRNGMPEKKAKGYYVQTKSKSHPYRSYHTNSLKGRDKQNGREVYSKFNNSFHDSWKVVFSFSGTWNSEVTNDCSLTDASFCILTETKAEALSVQSVIMSSFWTKMIDKVCRWSGYYSAPLLRNIPALPMNKIYTDEEVLEAYGLKSDKQKEFWLNK